MLDVCSIMKRFKRIVKIDKKKKRERQVQAQVTKTYLNIYFIGLYIAHTLQVHHN